MTRSNRRVRLLRGLAAALGLWTLLAAIPAASAHSVLIAVSPGDGSTVATAPTRVVLTFNEAVSKDFSQILVTDPAGKPVTEGGIVVSGAVVSQALQPDLPAGAYTVVFRVVSADGAPISQQTTFTVAGASSSSAASSPTSAPTSPGTEPTDSATALATSASGTASTAASTTTSGGDALPWVLGGLALLAVLTGGTLAWHRTRPTAQ